jgi:exopolyphosphatase/guanosine-5'-triphosphate,3'-diphosphate pyrophosphatase
MALRLAVILCHARREPDMKGLSLRATSAAASHWVLSCRNGWTTAYPQSAHLLREESTAWQKTPWAFEFHAP